MPLTQADRLKGLKNGLEERKRRRAERVKKSHAMYAEGLSKREIARRLNVKPNTIRLDLLETIDDTTE